MPAAAVKTSAAYMGPATPKPTNKLAATLAPRNGFGLASQSPTGVSDAAYGVRSVNMDPYETAVRAVEAKRGLGFKANPSDIARFSNEIGSTGQTNVQEIPQWLLDHAKPGAGRVGFTMGGLGAQGVQTQPGAVGDTTYKVGDTIFSGAHTGGYAKDNNTDVARAFDPNSMVSYANSPAYQQALKTGQWSLLNGTPYNVLDQNGKVIGTKKFEGLEDSDNMDMIALALTGAAIGGMGLTAAGGGAGAGAAGGGGASTGAATGAGVTGFGDAGAMYGGLDAASATTLGGGASIDGGAALGGGAAAAGGAGAGSSVSAVPPPANPFNVGSYANPANLGNLLKSGNVLTSVLGPAIGGAVTANAAGKAADAGLQATRESNALLKAIFDKQVELQEPFRKGGLNALSRLLDLYGLSGRTGAEGYGSALKKFGMEDFQADPGYQFRQDEGLKALERSASARGGLLSGGAAKDTLRFSQGLASDEYGRAYDRYGTDIARQINPLQALMGSGQSSANTIGDAAQRYGAGVSANTLAAGDLKGAGIMGRANAINGAIGQGVSMYQGNQLLQQQADYQNKLMQIWANR